MKRNPRKLRWTKSFRKARGKEMTIDPVFDFEKIRNRPMKYDRNLMQTTLRAMKRVDEIKTAREERHYQNRMKDAKILQKVQARKEIIDSIDVIAPEATKQRQNLTVLEKTKEKIRQYEEARKEVPSKHLA